MAGHSNELLPTGDRGLRAGLVPPENMMCAPGDGHTDGKEIKLHCEEHEEELKLFCETDKTLICLICRDAQEHREHRFMPIKEAVKTYKDQLKSSLDSLTKKKSDFQEKEQQQKEKISGVLEQSHSLQSHITSQFAELRQIITEKEQSLLRDLREEVKRILNPMEKNLREIQKNIRIIQEEISKLKEQMDQKDSVIFLKEEARRNRRINDNVQELSVTDETLPVEKFDHPYLLKTVLRETLDAINRVSKNERSHGNTKFFQGSTGRSEGGCFPCLRSQGPGVSLLSVQRKTPGETLVVHLLLSSQRSLLSLSLPLVSPQPPSLQRKQLKPVQPYIPSNP
ncbi:E3 ubiquitin-protein ligase TRIM62-like [Hemitrygon akajei]|uniref:E3 ubiquitin-protein ligase TRIM62-like n=1 Tax=Hemitrygon akajei TaxID=2704970 RepID=UPI003BF98B4A